MLVSAAARPVLTLPKFKTLAECEAKEHAWEEWGFRNGPKYKQAMKDADRFEAENGELHRTNYSLQTENESQEHTRIELI